MVHCTTDFDQGRRVRVWAKDGGQNQKLKPLHEELGMVAPDATGFGGGGGFIHGFPLSEERVATIRTCGGDDRPIVLGVMADAPILARSTEVIDES